MKKYFNFNIIGIKGWTNLQGLKYNQNTKDKDFQKGLCTTVFGPPYSAFTYPSSLILWLKRCASWERLKV